MFARNILTYGIGDPLGIARHDAIVIGQPTTAEMIAQYGLKHILFDFCAVTFKSFWAQFGWMGVLVNDRIYVLLFALTGAALFGLGLYALKIFRRRALLTTMQWWCVGLLVLLLVTAIADYIGYNSKFFQPQGRYLFPAMIPIALLLVIGLREIIAREYERVVFALLYVALLALDLASLFLFIVPQLRIAN
jgi:FtsH-binding integral membrane protein